MKTPLLQTLDTLQTTPILIPNMDVTCFETSEPNIYAALRLAADHFSGIHIQLPEAIIMNALRRIGEIPAEYWNTVYHGPVAITLYSPHDINLPEALKELTCSYTFFFCYRKHKKE